MILYFLKFDVTFPFQNYVFLVEMQKDISVAKSQLTHFHHKIMSFWSKCMITFSCMKKGTNLTISLTQRHNFVMEMCSAHFCDGYVILHFLHKNIIL